MSAPDPKHFSAVLPSTTRLVESKAQWVDCRLNSEVLDALDKLKLWDAAVLQPERDHQVPFTVNTA